MRSIFFLLLILTLFFPSLAIEMDIEEKNEHCMRFKAVEPEGFMTFDALSSGINNKLVLYRLTTESMLLITETRKTAEFHYTINNTKAGDIIRFCIKDLDGTKKTVFFNKYEHPINSATPSNKPVSKDSFEHFRSQLLILLEKLRKIEQGIRFRETLASNHIDLTNSNLDNIKYSSLAKVFIVGLITVAEIFILMKFVEKREKVHPR